jgi:glycosyltransferase involved in cell wall biosynthesis
MRNSTLYICYYNITEPLVRTQVVAYLAELAKRGLEVHLLTFERERLADDRRREIYLEMKSLGIEWSSLRYHQRPSLPATLYDIAAGTWRAFRLCRKHGIEVIHARSHVPAAMALTLQKLTGARFLFDLRGLMADEYVDAGHWNRDSLKFKLTKKMESVFFVRADAMVMLTRRIKQELLVTHPGLRGREGDITVIPCCVETERFHIRPDERNAYRKRRSWEGRRVLTYAGKLGTWYLTAEMARFFAAARRLDDRFFFQVLTQSDPGLIQRELENAGVSGADYDIRYAAPDELPLILSSSDAGISFIRPCYSKLASSPTKVGEYLAAGLPVVANAGIGDCDEMLAGAEAGVVACDFSDEEFSRVARELMSLLDEDGAPARCRDYTERELSMTRVGGPLYAGVYAGLLKTGERVAESAAAV